MLSKFIFPFVFLVTLACSYQPQFKVIKKVNVPVDASLPEPLVQELSAKFLKTNPQLKLDLEKVVSKFGFYKKVQWPINVRVWPKNKNLQTARDFQSKDETTKIDLSQFVSLLGDETDFYMQVFIKTERFNKLYVYFLPSFSENKKCNKFYNITDHYHKGLSQKVLLSKDDKHYIKNYMGTYVFFSVLNQDTYQLNLVQVTNSSVGDQLCPYF